MRYDQFDEVLEKLTRRVKKTLAIKGDEYASGLDRLQAFKVAAALRGTDSVETLLGMMLKHTVSIYDMGDNYMAYTIEQWDEKIIDHICYLILLRAVLTEESFSGNNTPQDDCPF